MIENIPIIHTNNPGKQFVKVRNVSMRDFSRFMDKLHGDVLLDRYDLAKALVEKDIQRLNRYVHKYVESESEKYDDCAIFMKRDMTVQELSDVDYILSYRVFIELYVGEIKEEK